MSIDLIIFDCDGVLVDSEAIYVAAELEFLASAGLCLDRASYMQDFMGLSPGIWQQRLVHRRKQTDQVICKIVRRQLNLLNAPVH